MAQVTPELVAALIGVGYIAGWLTCWPIARRRGELKAARRWNIDPDPDDGEWWEL